MYVIIILKGKKEQAKALIYRRQQIINVEKNFDLIKKSNVTDIQIWTDLYMTKGNHGFEVFTRGNLNKLFGMNVALPIDFHILSKKSIIEFADEMNIKYNKKSEIY